MTILITGVAGFIGAAVAGQLLANGHHVIGLDSLNDYYDPALKQARLAQLRPHSGFAFHQVDLADQPAVDAFFARVIRLEAPITGLIHLAAQAGVRYSLTNPQAYVASNVMGLVNVLEGARRLSALTHVVYASSSSVYGGNRKVPFATTDPVEKPVNLYAATKRADELIAYSYAHLYGLPLTGLRFFTVYGPWGRPDMAYYLFAQAMRAGQPIKLHGDGLLKRDFTYIDDVVAGVLAALDKPAPADEDGVRHRLFNLGNNQPETVLSLVEALEGAMGVSAIRQLVSMQPGEVAVTMADITASQQILGFAPKTSLREGIGHFAQWFQGYVG
jgi:UDP-glucuronate 4-epimerase